MKTSVVTSPEYDAAVKQRLWELWIAASGKTSPDIFLAFYKAGQKGYKLEDLTLDNLKKVIGGSE